MTDGASRHLGEPRAWVHRLPAGSLEHRSHPGHGYGLSLRWARSLGLLESPGSWCHRSPWNHGKWLLLGWMGTWIHGSPSGTWCHKSCLGILELPGPQEPRGSPPYPEDARVSQKPRFMGACWSLMSWKLPWVLEPVGTWVGQEPGFMECAWSLVPRKPPGAVEAGRLQVGPRS